jgi:hypothetical protein
LENIVKFIECARRTWYKNTARTQIITSLAEF